ncbi:MAG: indolepyruvate ferredoxin oxidoreductase subunit alpha [Ruminococcus sp.]|nr:indolepyruvate ferredoxin oxidoreductase subunit alpha [Ruminococcus sp.]MBQ4247044.1 indolepyruvate ferredoxin oxidoreductase subunit alpha [Ruminococcus sp.]
MGNEAIGLGAIHAGVNLVAGYPGTPSTEILETVAKNNDGSIHVEWSVNEKAALEVAAGGAYAGARVLVTMKQVGLNVASDPLMSLAYVGVKGAMVIVSADDPGPISSQTEQDTRHFAHFCKLPVFDPSSPEEAYEMIKDAFDYSEKYQTPVLFRPTTRICHGCGDILVDEKYEKHIPEGFVKDTMRWVIFPRTSFLNHQKIEKRNPQIGDEFSSYRFNTITGSGKKGICTHGASYGYVMESLEGSSVEAKVYKVATPFPFPEKQALDFLRGLDEVMCFEELDPVLERELIYICGKYGLNVKIHGKIDGCVQSAGENSAESVAKVLESFLGIKPTENAFPKPPELPVRPPVLCAGCPHRASFYAVKQAVKGRKAVFSGDIGCYTLGNAMPLDMVDTCLCMGADVTIAQGLHIIQPDTLNFSFIGDSTFFASGITGVVNAVYNQNDIILIVLDNSTTAMTGHQPHPGTGVTMMGEVAQKVSIEAILKAIGLTSVETVDPLDLSAAVGAVQRAAEKSGVRAVIFKSPCIAVTKSEKKYEITDKCVGCKKCISQLGCPAIVIDEGRVTVEKSLCFGCSLCAQVCPVGAIEKREG